MSVASLVRTLPPRLAAGAFILNSGVGKLSADEETAARLHGMAASTYPFLGKMKPQDFARALAIGEIAVGTTLLLPVVPAGPGRAGPHRVLRRPARPVPQDARRCAGKAASGRPSKASALAKDAWLLGIGRRADGWDGLTGRVSSTSG